MRIIRGRYQRRQIHAPNNLPVRPTTDMAKESLFNILENSVDFEDITVLDLFAGTGNISYEFVSRGSKKVVSVDENQGCVRFIRETATALKMEELVAFCSDVFRFISSHKSKYDVIFADPPYDCEHYSQLVKLIFEHELLNDNGILVVEHSRSINFSDYPNFEEERKYGKVHFSFFNNDKA